MARIHPVVFLVDVDNTLLDNDVVQQDLKGHLERAYGRDARDRYWRILEGLFSELGYRDFLLVVSSGECRFDPSQCRCAAMPLTGKLIAGGPVHVHGRYKVLRKFRQAAAEVSGGRNEPRCAKSQAEEQKAPTLARR